MSTKDHQDWLSKQNQTFDNNEISEANQYNNINLNHQNYKDENGWKTLNSDNSNGRKDYDFVNSNKSSLLKFEKDVKNSWKSGGDISKHLETLNLYDSEDDKKRWKQAWNLSDTKKNNNNSTLSLHIAAYENSVAASEIKSDIDQIDKQSNKDIKTWKNIKDTLADSSSVAQNSFEFPRQNNNDQPMIPEIMQFKASQKLCNVKDQRSNARKQKCARVADVAEELSVLFEQNQITKEEFVDRLNAKNEELGYKEKMVHKSWLQIVGNVEKRFQQNNNAFVSELDKRIAEIHRKFKPNFCLSGSLDSQQDAQDTSSSVSHIASSTASNSNHDEQTLQRISDIRNSDESDDDDATESNVTAAGDEEEQQVAEKSQKSRRPYGLLKLGGIWAKKDEPKRMARNFAAEEERRRSPLSTISSSRKRRFESDSSKTSAAATSKRTSDDENQRCTKIRRLQQTAASEKTLSQNNLAQDGIRSDVSDSITEALAQPISHQTQLNWLRRKTANNLVPVIEERSTPTRLQPSRTAKSNHGQVSVKKASPQQQSSPSIPLTQQKLKPGSICNPQIPFPLLDSLSLMQAEQDAAAGNTAQKVQEPSEANSPQDQQPIVESQSELHLQKTAETANEKISAAVINPSQLQTNALNSTEMQQHQSNPANLNAAGLRNPGGIIPLQVHTSSTDPQPPHPHLQQGAYVTANVNPAVFNQRPFQQRQQNPPQNNINNSIQDLLAQHAANSAQIQQSIHQRLHQLNEPPNPQQLLPTLPNQQPSYFTFLQNLNKNQKDIFDFQSARNLELIRTTIAAANQAMGVKNNNNGN